MSYSYNQYNYRSNDANFGGSAGRSGGEINGNDEYDRGRQKRNGSRSRSRSESRDRKRRGSTNYDREGNRSYGQGGYRENYNRGNSNSGNGSNNEYRGHTYGFNRSTAEPSTTVVIKGLPVQTTEPTDGECKGFAFIEFPSLEYSQYFMATYAGSAGDPNAAQLIIENRSVIIEYAREQTDRRPKDEGRRDDKQRALKGDWLCEACACHNFSRRDTCYRCNIPRSERSITVATGGDAFGDSLVTSDIPSAFLVVRGFGPYVSEEQIAELFRQFALVKSTVLIRDQQGRVSKTSMAFVEFHSVEHASYAMQCSSDLKMDTISLKVSFAKEQVMHQIINQYHLMISQTVSHPIGAIHQPNALVATALQAAQWSVNNGYGGTTGPVGTSKVPTVSAVSAVPKQLWPKHFETNGAAYTFQPKTGYFLDTITEFFYCPKSKLYYSAKDGVYYLFDPTLDPPYKRFDPPIPTEEEIKADNKASDDPSSNRAPISVSLGLKAKNNKAVGPANQVAKKVMLDMAKWGAIQKNDDDEGGVDSSSKLKNPNPPASSLEGKMEIRTTATAGDSALVVSTTGKMSSASNAFVCKLCKRQFNSAEMLTRHEKESKLHAENLAKQKAATAPRQYRDRAEERREKFGSVPDHIVATAPIPSGIREGTLIPPNSDPVAPVLFDESNPGNQMLRKMGWKEGQGLGKDGDGREEAIGVELSAGKNINTAMHSTLKSTTGVASGGSNGALSYKESVKATTLARFEQLQRSEGK